MWRPLGTCPVCPVLNPALGLPHRRSSTTRALRRSSSMSHRSPLSVAAMPRSCWRMGMLVLGPPFPRADTGCIVSFLQPQVLGQSYTYTYILIHIYTYTHTHTHTHTYIYTSWLPGFARDPPSPPPPPSHSSLPSALPPSDYPASARIFGVSSLKITPFPRYI